MTLLYNSYMTCKIILLFTPPTWPPRTDSIPLSNTQHRKLPSRVRELSHLAKQREYSRNILFQFLSLSVLAQSKDKRIRFEFTCILLKKNYGG